MSAAVSDRRACRDAVPDHADSLTAVRYLKDGRGRQFSETTWPNAAEGCRFWVRRFELLGFIRPCERDSEWYALLDVLGENGDILATFEVPTAQGFRYIKRMLHLVVTHTDGDPIRPTAPTDTTED